MVKIDTKENFLIFSLSEEKITEEMADELKVLLLKKREKDPGNAIVSLPENGNYPSGFFNQLKEVQDRYSNQHLSFYLTPVSENLKKSFPEITNLNFTRTLQEAIDMVMMEILERELLGPDTEG